MTTLLLLHGLGATASAWAPLLAHLASAGDEGWPGPVRAPDLPGHGAAERLPGYGVSEVARALGPTLTGPVAVLGHSYGGAVGVALANGRYGTQVTAAVALGVKVHWPDADVERFAALAARPPRTFATRDEALVRHLAMAGLVGQPPEQHESGVMEAADGWQLAMDPAALAQSSPELARLVIEATAPVALLRGEHDQLVSSADLRACATPATGVLDLPGLGHNAHVEDPVALWAAVGPLLRT